MNQWKIQYLEKEFTKKQDWDKRDQQRLSKKLGFEISKIYKWNWEKKKKLLAQVEKWVILRIEFVKTYSSPLRHILYQ